MGNQGDHLPQQTTMEDELVEATDTNIFESRRGVICVRHGVASSSQPLASQAGLTILRQGGNAADAAVAVAAGLNVTQPTSTGLGGDVFCLFYDAATKTVKGINGSGRCPQALTLQRANAAGFNESNPFPIQHGMAVTVPGAAAAWVDLVETYGSGQVTMAQILQPAIQLADEGFPLSQMTGQHWRSSLGRFNDPRNTYGSDFLINGRTPLWGEVFRNPHLADSFRTLANEGKKGFYEGRIAEAIVRAVAAFDGVMTTADLAAHTSTFDQPLSVDYKGVRLWEMPPNGQGIVALQIMNILNTFDLKAMGHNSLQYLHTLIEATRLSFADASRYIADPSIVPVPVGGMLSSEYAATRRSLINPARAMTNPVPPGDPWPYRTGNDTVYFSVVDAQGNACSFINSNYQGFGTCIVPQGCGITLQNRGANFSLQAGHPNVIYPNKRPYHTIIPALVTDVNTGELLANLGVMGGFMQPQGHAQVLLNMLEFGMHPQQAIDAARFQVMQNNSGDFAYVRLEEGIPPEVIAGLVALGHDARGPDMGVTNRSQYGWGQIITRGAWWKQSDLIANDPSVWWVGVDPRCDGNAAVY